MQKKIRSFVAVMLVVLMFASICSTAAYGTNNPQIKNIIYLIGDGMGPNQLASYKKYANVAQLEMEKYPIQGYQVTRSFGKILTDSAAGGTALATGVHTWVNAVGVYPDDPFNLTSHPKNLREIAQEQGMKTGIVVTKSSDDATPAAFSAHSFSRSNDEDINEQQLKCGIDVLMGASTGFINAENAAANGFQFATNTAQMNAITSGKMIGQYSGGDLKGDYDADQSDNPWLVTMAEKAVSLLENPNGFFLMIEGSTIDSYCHSNDMNGMLNAFAAFERAVKFSLDYAKAHNDTLVVITADHETGGITLDSETGEYYFTTTGHSNANVPYFVYSPVQSAFTNGEVILNIDVAKNIAKTAGWGEDIFPAAKESKDVKVLSVIQVALSSFAHFFFELVDRLIDVLPESVQVKLPGFYLSVVDALTAVVSFIGDL